MAKGERKLFTPVLVLVNKPFLFLGAIITCALLALVLFLPEKAQAAQTVPYKVNFQGRLTDNAGNIMANGNYNMKFRLFSVSSGGTDVWNETRDIDTAQVTVTNGLFSVQLGDHTALSPSLFTSQPLYLEVELPTTGTATCATSACAVWTEGAMTPRQPLGSSPYAMNADTVDGIDGASLAQLGANNTYTGTTTFQNTVTIQDTTDSVDLFSADFSNNKIQIGSSTTDAVVILLGLDNYNGASDPTGFNGAMYYNSSLGRFRCYENGAWWDCIGSDSERTRKMPMTFTDFLGNVGATGQEPTVPWDWSPISSGDQSSVTPWTSHPGVVDVSSSTTANSGGYYRTRTSAFKIEGGEATEFVFQPKVSGNTDTTIRMGFLNGNSANDATEGAYFELPAGSMNIVGKTAHNSVWTTSSTIATLTVDTWYRAKLVVNSDATSITFNIYNDSGTLLGSQSIATNMPTFSTGHGVIATNAGTTALALVWLDYMALWYEGRLLTR